MIPLLGENDLVLEARNRQVAQLGRYRLATASGTELGWAVERGVGLRSLRRLFTPVPGHGPAQFDVVDVEGNRVLEVTRRRLGVLCHLEVTVSLSDATPVGSADGPLNIRRSTLALRNPAGAVLAQLHGGDARGYELLDPSDEPIGTVAPRLVTLHARLPPGVHRAYDITFPASVGVAVRSLTLATLICIDLRRL